MSNLTIFERNVIAAIQAYECASEAEGLFLRASQRNALLAERCAVEWAELLHPVLTRVQRLTSEGMNFIRERHFRHYFPNH